MKIAHCLMIFVLAIFFHFHNTTDKIMAVNLSWENCDYWGVPVECAVCGAELDPGEEYTFEWDAKPGKDYYWEVRWIPARQYWDYEPDIQLLFRPYEGGDVHWYLKPDCLPEYVD